MYVLGSTIHHDCHEGLGDFFGGGPGASGATTVGGDASIALLGNGNGESNEFLDLRRSALSVIAAECI